MQRPARVSPALIGLSALIGLAPAVSAQGEWTRPKYQLNPQNEDWSGIETLPAEQRDWADRLKWMALDDAGDWRLTVGGRARGRIEGWSNFGQTENGSPRSDDIFELLRLRAHGDLQHSSGFRAYVELKSALAWDRQLPGGTRSIDEDQLDVHQGFLEQGFDVGQERPLTLRVGRQALAFGRQRLVSPLPWANVLRTWDGASARVPLGDWNVDAFWTEFVVVDDDAFNEAGDDQLFGLYGTRGLDGKVLDLYLLGTQRDGRTFNGTTGNEDRYTLGARYARPAAKGETDFELEFAVQEGDIDSQDIHAWMVGGEFGVSFVGDGAPRLNALIEIGSGDSSAGGSVGTFDTPYPLGHAYYGIADTLGRQNAIDIGLGGTWPVGERTTLAVTAHQFLRTNDGDAIYNAGGAPIAGTAGGGSGSSDIGQELDLVLTSRIDRHTTWQAGYSHFWTGSVLDDVGLDADTDFVYLQLSYAF
ncbi:alginate export family protein [Engelhardtia mirabilis]|uniref:Alginate export domain-containing protein n=1 Tax=Engelhardtia mirabilis TaxID=2528011 RepID=A0A518BQE8_9BACT|nr:hypothetical protein Pla133_43130 [Planctomycetes bacterium Pla133]QDV03523.1 hypothetical protein Pla86_43120 [Planctomycetes bacterium Pla86]